MGRLALSIIHNLQLALGVVNRRGLTVAILIDRLVFKSSASTTKGYILARVNSLLVYGHWTWVISFFITNSPNIRLISNFTFIIEMRVALHIL